jgi:L-fuculose-phosphate aldolase
MSNSQSIREELCRYAQKTVANKLVVGPGGNISTRHDGKMYLSPSGFALDEIRPEQWVEVDIATGDLTDCIAFTLVARDLPIMFPDQAALVGRTVYVPYVLPTTDKLADAVVEKVSEASSILLGNHGLVTTGRNLREAYYRTEVVEESSKIYLIASAIREPKVMTSEEYEEIASLESEAYRIQLLQRMK